MKKKYLFISLYFSFMLFLCSCGTDTYINQNTYNIEETDVQYEENNKENYWFLTMNWDITSNKEISSLFYESILLPIDLNIFDNIVESYQYFFDGFDKTESFTMSEILKNPQLFYDKVYIWFTNDTKTNIYNLCFVNYNIDQEITIQQSYDNRWWYIHSIENFDKIFQIDIKNLSNEYEIEVQEKPLLNAIIEKYGKPSYIAMSDIYMDSIDKFEDDLWYEIVYEFTDYVITISIQEKIDSSNNTYITIHNVNYYTNECWQQELNKFPISSENIINDINIKFQKIE